MIRPIFTSLGSIMFSIQTKVKGSFLFKILNDELNN